MNDSHLNQTRGNLDDLWLLTLPQVAKRLQVSLSDVRRKVRRGVIPIVRLGPRQVRVSVSDLEAYIRARRRSPTEEEMAR